MSKHLRKAVELGIDFITLTEDGNDINIYVDKSARIDTAVKAMNYCDTNKKKLVDELSR